MLFKNLQSYFFNTKISKADFEKSLSNGVFSGCPSNMMSSRGWVSPLPHDEESDQLVYRIGDHWLICLCEEKRLLPASVVNDETKKEANKLAAKQGYPAGRKQLREIKDSVIERLMPKAFLKRSKTWAWIDSKNGYIGIDASSRSGADSLIEQIRLCCDEFPLMPIDTEISPGAAMTSWLLGDEAMPETFVVDRECELRDEEKATVAYKKHLLSDEAAPQIAKHLSGGKVPVKLALTWNDQLSFVLTEKFEIKRLGFLFEESEDEVDKDSAESAFEADFALMTGTLSRFLPAVIEALGGARKTEGL